MIDLSYVVRRAWEITRRHPVLWLFGFMVSLGTISARFGVGSSRWERIARELPPEMERAALDFLAGPYATPLIVALVILTIVLSVGLALLGAVGRGALVDQVRAAEDSGVVSLRSGWREGKRSLWTVFLIRLLLGLPASGVTLAGALPVAGAALLVARKGQPITLVSGVLAVELALLACLLPAICVAVLLSAPLSALQRLAVRGSILEGHNVGRSIANAWSMLRYHLGPLALVWLILLCVRVGAIVVILLPLVLLVALFAAISLLTAFVSPLLFIGLTLSIGLLAWLAGAAVNGVVETFMSAVWTLTYRELTGLGLTGEEGLQASHHSPS